MDGVSTRRHLALALALFAGIAVAVLGFLWAWPVGSLGVFEEFVQPPLPAASPSQDFIGQPLTRRLLVVIHDSVRHDAAMDPEAAPFRAALAARGASGRLWVPGPTLTGVSLTCFGSGVSPPMGTAFSNFVLERWPDEDVVDLARRRHPSLRLGCFGDEPFFRLFGETARERLTYPSEKMAVPFDREGIWLMDRRAMNRAREVVAAGDWDLVVVHLSTTDKKAHLHHARVRERDGALSAYGAALRVQDAYVEELAALAGDDATVFWLSDHGCTPGGTHGTFERETREAVWAAAGPGIGRQDAPVDLDATALATLWGRLLGVRGPRRSEGVVPAGLVRQSEADALAALRVNRNARRAWAAAFCAANGWEVDLGAPAPADDAVALRRELEGLAPAVAAAQERARRGKQAVTAVVALGLSLLLVFLTLRIRGASARAARRLALGLTVLLVSLFAWRWWPWSGMVLAQVLCAWHPLAAVAVATALGLLAAVGLRRFGTGTRLGRGAVAEAAVAESLVVVLGVLAGFLVVAWPFGPKRETFGLLPILVGTTAVCLLLGADAARRSRRAWGSLAAWTALLWMSHAWIDDELEVIWAARDPAMLPLGPVLAPLLWLLLAGLLLATGGLGPAARARPGRLLALIPLVPFGLATAARMAEGGGAEGRARMLALGTVVAWLFVLGLAAWRRGLGPMRPAAAAVLASLGLYRLLVVDANLVFALAFAASAWLLFGALAGARAPGPFGRAALILLLVAGYWFLQGYRYKESTFDSLVAFAFRKDGVAGLETAAPFLLQQLVPWILASAPALAFRDPATTRPPALLVGIATIFLLRVTLVPLALPLYRDEGWFFLWVLHFVAFEAGQALLAALALGLAGERRPTTAGA